MIGRANAVPSPAPSYFNAITSVIPYRTGQPGAPAHGVPRRKISVPNRGGRSAAPIRNRRTFALPVAPDPGM